MFSGYDSCRTDSNNSYSVGGWCFCIYRNSSWPSSYPVQDVAQTMCGPNGNLAVGVTYKMLNKIMNLPRIAVGSVQLFELAKNQ